MVGITVVQVHGDLVTRFQLCGQARQLVQGSNAGRTGANDSDSVVARWQEAKRCFNRVGVGNLCRVGMAVVP
ncbi:hypothetical protein D3C81_1752070 [compost metagenome]